MIGSVIFTVFLVIASIFMTVRVARLWTRDERYFSRVSAWTAALPVRAAMSRGLARGVTPLTAGLIFLTFSFVLITIFVAPQATSTAAPRWAVLLATSFLAVFLAGVALQFTIAWFNRPRWCVPRYLRGDLGALQASRHQEREPHGEAPQTFDRREYVGMIRPGMTSLEISKSFDEKAGEQVLRRSGASEMRGGISFGGHLILTDQRLAFVPHAVNISRDVSISPVSAITKCSKGTKINTIDVDFRDGGLRSFVVFRRNEWIKAIERAAAG